jgi:hypothetical protein
MSFRYCASITQRAAGLKAFSGPRRKPGPAIGKARSEIIAALRGISRQHLYDLTHIGTSNDYCA